MGSCVQARRWVPFTRGPVLESPLGRLLVAHLWEPFTFLFIFDDTNTSFTEVDNPSSKLIHPVAIYNSSYGNCLYFDIKSGEKKQMETCVLRKGEFSFRIPEIVWLHKGAYFACDDKGLYLDAIFIDIQETGNLTPSGNGNPLLYVLLGIGGIIIAFLAYLWHKYRTRLCVDRMSSIDTFKGGNKDDGEENIQEKHSLGRYLTVVSRERGELISAAIEAPLFGDNFVPATNELEHSMKLDSVQGSDVFNWYLNPVHSCPVKVDGYIHPVPSCSVELDEYISPINSSTVNSGFVSILQSTEF